MTVVDDVTVFCLIGAGSDSDDDDDDDDDEDGNDEDEVEARGASGGGCFIDGRVGRWGVGGGRLLRFAGPLRCFVSDDGLTGFQHWFASMPAISLPIASRHSTLSGSVTVGGGADGLDRGVGIGASCVGRNMESRPLNLESMSLSVSS
jgi:hypothetical protein